MRGFGIFEADLRRDRIPTRVEHNEVAIRKHRSIFGAERNQSFGRFGNLGDVVERECNRDAQGVVGGLVV